MVHVCACVYSFLVLFLCFFSFFFLFVSVFIFYPPLSFFICLFVEKEGVELEDGEMGKIWEEMRDTVIRIYCMKIILFNKK